MAKNQLLAIDVLRNMLDYDCETGVIRWRLKRGQRVKAGDVAGSKHSDGYWRIGVCGKYYLAHRIAWALHYGEWPKKQIDHINGVKLDNRIENLRLATNAQNQHNRSNPRTDNNSGFLGVSRHKKTNKWIAQITIAKKTNYLGSFCDPLEAHQAYLAAKRVAHPFSRSTERAETIARIKGEQS